MNLVNTTSMPAAYTMTTAPDGRESLVVVVKGTFAIPDRPEMRPRLAEEQLPPTMTDEFTGEPGSSAVRYECDFAAVKPRCDVLLNGSAYAPGGKPTERVAVSLQVGAMTKGFNVVGDRVYNAGLLYLAASDPKPFTKMPISYDNAFGGVDRSNENPAKHRWYLLNHAGVGFFEDTSAKVVNGKQLPNTEEIGRGITRPSGGYTPMAYGVIGRAWKQRIQWAGTYDQKWIDNRFPYLPADFDPRYFQAAAADQQIEYPKGGEEVVLSNLTPQGRTVFRLPKTKLPIVWVLRDGTAREGQAVVDTIILEPDEMRFLLVWRASQPLRRNMFEVRHMIVGKSLERWQRDERPDALKKRFRSLAELAAWRPQPDKS